MGNIFNELRRRNVFRIAGVYAVVGWLLAQVSVTLETAIGLPPWFDGFVIALLLIGFPIALILAWAFEMTPEGMKLTAAVPESESIHAKTGKKLDYVIIGGLALVVVIIGADRMMPEQTIAANNIGDASNASRTANAAPEISAATIAVLPFTDLSPDKDQEYFADGISEEILNVLANIDALDVTSRTSAFAFKSQSELSIRDIAASLKVRHVLEGSVRKAGNNIRITAQLIDAQTDQHLWSETYDKALTAENVFAIQDEIAKAITIELKQRLNVDLGFEDAPRHSGGTTEIDAYAAYLKGRDLLINRNYVKLPLAIAAFEQAVAADSAFARGWGSLAVAYAVSPDWAFFDRDYRALAKDAAERALALDPENSMAFTALGQNNVSQDYEVGIDYYLRAIAVDPKNTTAILWLAQTYSRLGYFDRALETVSRCLDIDPNYPICMYTYVEIQLLAGRYNDAMARLSPLMATEHTETYSALLGVVAQHEPQLLLEFMLGDAVDTLPGDTRWMVPYLTRALSDEDYDREAALALLITRLRDQGYNLDSDPYSESVVRLAFRNYDEMPLDNAPDWWWFPGYKGLHQSAAAHAAIRAAKLPDYWREHGFPPQCKPISTKDGGKDDFECE